MSNFVDYILTPDLNQTLIVIDILATLFTFVIGSLFLVIVITYFRDKYQTGSALKANFPIFVRVRYLSEAFGKFVRSWILSEERSELPFNRSQRTWVYKAARNLGNYQSFGSTRKIDEVGTIIFSHSAFPKLAEEKENPDLPKIGNYVSNPYVPGSFFNVSGMSYGAISKNAVLSLSRGAHEGNFWMNTGEGGASSWHFEGGADLVYQIGTAKYGVRDEDGNLCEKSLKALSQKEQIKMFEVKLSQGAKPGAGGVLPGHKITQEIAKIRGIPLGFDSLSPNRHKEINDYASLLDFLMRIRTVTDKPVGIKAAIGSNNFIEDLAKEIHKKGLEYAPDFITIDSADGGTGAAPISLFDYAGQLLRESLPTTHKILTEAGLRDHIKLIASGKLINPADVAWALAMGADFTTSARGFMFSLGCIQALECAENKCPTGIATQDTRRMRALVPAEKYLRVKQYHGNLVYEVEKLALACGVTYPWALSPDHVRIVMGNYRTIPITEWMHA